MLEEAVVNCPFKQTTEYLDQKGQNRTSFENQAIEVYNSGTWGLTRMENEDLNSFHRKQSRRILYIKYPTIISNK